MNITSFIGKHKYELDTPCLVIDITALKTNLSYMQQFGERKKVGIRPHCKTHKCSQLAQLQMKFGAIGLCVTKVSEAEVLIDYGLDNILITSPIVTPYKQQRLASCLRKSPSLMMVVDNEKNLIDLNTIGRQINKKVNILIDIDSGIGRTGINQKKVLEFAQFILTFDFLNLKGVQCYAGNLQHIYSYNERKKKSLDIMIAASSIVTLLKNNNIPCDILTGTGTGTYDIDIDNTLVTEIQPGSYTVMDVEYVDIESASSHQFDTFKHAMTLLTTVISTNRTEHVTADAGTKGIYFDNSTKPKIINYPELDYDWSGFGDEHGKITSKTNQLPSIGTVLEMIVPHCDPTINLYDYFFITKQDIVIDIWPIDLRGKSQ